MKLRKLFNVVEVNSAFSACGLADFRRDLMLRVLAIGSASPKEPIVVPDTDDTQIEGDDAGEYAQRHREEEPGLCLMAFFARLWARFTSCCLNFEAW
jgi:hypothetical protein